MGETGDFSYYQKYRRAGGLAIFYYPIQNYLFTKPVTFFVSAAIVCDNARLRIGQLEMNLYFLLFLPDRCGDNLG